MAEEPKAKNPGITSGVRNILIILAVLILIGAAGYFLFFRNRDNSNGNELADTADEIRRSFLDSGTTTPADNAPPQGGGFPAPTTTAPVPPPQPEPGPARPQAPPSVPAQPKAPAVYSNPALGLEITLPAGWADTVKTEGNRILFFDARSGGMAGYAEIYDAPQVTIQELEATLANNPSIQFINRVTISGWPALKYKSGSEDAIAMARNGRVIYLHGGLASAEITRRMKFASQTFGTVALDPRPDLY